MIPFQSDQNEKYILKKQSDTANTLKYKARKKLWTEKENRKMTLATYNLTANACFEKSKQINQLRSI